MRSSIVDVAGGTFVVSAMSYAAGIAYFNAYFRTLNANPYLFTVPLERVLFEGGRQLLHLVFTPAVVLSVLLLFFVLARFLMKKFGFKTNFLSSLKSSYLWVTISAWSWLYIFILLGMLGSYSFYSGTVAGKKYGDESVCSKATVTTEKESHTGCLVYKTDNEVWLAVGIAGKSKLISIPNDKFLSVVLE